MVGRKPDTPERPERPLMGSHFASCPSDPLTAANAADATDNEDPEELRTQAVVVSLPTQHGLSAGAASEAVGPGAEGDPEHASSRLIRVGVGEQYTSIADAVGSCLGGELILIQPGTYHISTPVLLRHDVTLQADASGEGEVLVSSVGGMFEWRQATGRICGLKLKQRVTDERDQTPMINLLSGDLAVENCELEARGGAAIYAHGMSPEELSKFAKSADYTEQGLAQLGLLVEQGARGVRLPPRVQVTGCRISSRRAEGLAFEFGVAATVERCEIVHVQAAGVSVQMCGSVSVCRNQIHEVNGSGILFYGGATGCGPYLAERNDIFEAGLSGIELLRASDTHLGANRVHHCAGAGILMRLQSKALVVENELFSNTLANFDATDGSQVTLRSNDVHSGSHVGVLFRGKSKGLVEGNKIHANACPNVEVRASSRPLLKRNAIYDGQHIGLLYRFDGEGEATENEVYSNALAGVHVHKRSSVELRRNHVHSGRGRGIFVESDATAVLDSNNVHDNAVEAEVFEPPKVLKQTPRQWIKTHAWKTLEAMFWDLAEDPEASYPKGYEIYKEAGYRGDFDGISGEVVYQPHAEGAPPPARAHATRPKQPEATVQLTDAGADARGAAEADGVPVEGVPHDSGYSAVRTGSAL